MPNSANGIGATTDRYIPAGLSIKQVLGTSASNSREFCIKDNVIAYTASGGVVVCKIDLEKEQLVSQRFFCANSEGSGSGQGAHSSANAYLNMALGELEESAEVQKDEFGYFKNTDPMEVTGVSSSEVKKSVNGAVGTERETSPSKLKERIRSVNCLSISPDKKLVAIGETGYQPRVLVFSLAPDSSSRPIAQILEHTFGVHSVVFSPDSKYLCSLGLINDGFINVWRVSPTSISLVRSNRCTSIINSIIWHECFIITVGLRFIKVWKMEEENSKLSKNAALKGKNVLLGSLMNSNFKSAHLMNNDELLVVSNTYDILLLKLDYDDLKLVSLDVPIEDVTNLSVDHEDESVWAVTEEKIERLPLSALVVRKETQSPASKRSNILHSPGKSVDQNDSILKMTNLNKHSLIYLSNCESLILFNKVNKQRKPLIKSLIKDFSGVCTSFSGDLLIFSRNGFINRFKRDCTFESVFNFKLPSNDLISNSLMSIDSDMNNVFLGDKFGAIYICETQGKDSYKVVQTIKAHSSTINEIVFFRLKDRDFLVSISRDRMIQVFYKVEGAWDIFQTLPVHNGNLLKVKYHEGRIFVSSSDRTISIHSLQFNEEEITLGLDKMISLKATPSNFEIYDNELVVSSNDKCLSIYNTDENFELKRTLKLTNEKINESLQVESFIIDKQHIIVSSSDKSLRMFNYISGRPVSAAWGHSETILRLIKHAENELISISTDGCLFIWNLKEPKTTSTQSPKLQSSVVEEESIPVYSKVTRRILPTSPVKSNFNRVGDTEVQSPVSATSPRLSNATLKRIEAKQKLERESSGTGLKSPVQTQASRTRSPVRSVNPKARNPSESPTRVSSSPPKSLNSHLLKFSQPSEHSKRNLFAPSLNKTSVKDASNNAENFDPTETILKNLETIGQLLNSSKVPESGVLKISSKMANIQRSLNTKDESSITRDLKKLNINEQENIANESTNKSIKSQETILLQEYSDKLVRLVEQKLNGNSKQGTTTSLKC